MSHVNIDDLNHQFALGDYLQFKTGPGNLTFAEIDNEKAKATICLQGAQILSWQPHHQASVLWLGDRVNYESGKSIRGGIPLCWPWFGDHPDDSEKPAHGFVRTQQWSVLSTDSISGDKTQIKLGYSDTHETRLLYPHTFALVATLTVGEQLGVELKACNSSDQSYTYGGALHSYFSVSDISKIKILGLEDTQYIDKVDGFSIKTQQGNVTIDQETDNIYTDTQAECVIEDTGFKRRIHIAKKGSKSTVVWNPWINKTKTIADMPDDAYQHMVCVETANAAEDKITVPAFVSRILKTTIATEPMI